MSDEDRPPGVATRQLGAGHTPDGSTHSRVVPACQITSYTFQHTEHAADLLALKELGHLSNGARRMFHRRRARGLALAADGEIADAGGPARVVARAR